METQQHTTTECVTSRSFLAHAPPETAWRSSVFVVIWAKTKWTTCKCNIITLFLGKLNKLPDTKCVKWISRHISRTLPRRATTNQKRLCQFFPWRPATAGCSKCFLHEPIQLGYLLFPELLQRECAWALSIQADVRGMSVAPACPEAEYLWKPENGVKEIL